MFLWSRSNDGNTKLGKTTKTGDIITRYGKVISTFYTQEITGMYII